MLMSQHIPRPQPDEYAPYYAQYIDRVPGEDVIAVMLEQISLVRGLVGGLSDEQAAYRFAPDEWTIKQVIGHINDVERVFAFRALCFSRKEPAALPSFEQEPYVREADFDQRPLAEMVDEFELLRRANVLAFKRMSPEMSSRRGIASGLEFTVRSVIYVMAGHVFAHAESLQSDYGLRRS
jgi:hypothetical protein